MRRRKKPDLNVKPEVDYITIVHNVFFSLYGKLAGISTSGFRTEPCIIIELNYLCADESLLKIRMNDSGSLWSRHAFMNGPGADFFFPCGKKSNQVQQAVRFANQL